MITNWAAGGDVDAAGQPLPGDRAWQAELWRRLRARIGVPSPAERLADACAALRADGGLVDLPPELVQVLRFGRGIDNRRFKEAGFEYRHTTAGAVEAFMEALRLRRTLGSKDTGYRYEEDIEQFFRHSPAVQRNRPQQ